MREILFRGKCIETGRNKDKWLYGYLGADKPDEVFIAPIPEDGSALVGYYCDSSTIGQYTGLTANGKKIFEGDILDYFDTLYIVSWSDNLLTYIVTSVDEKKEYLFFLYKANMDCVYNVGNIHDNPELLEAKV